MNITLGTNTIRLPDPDFGYLIGANAAALGASLAAHPQAWGRTVQGVTFSPNSRHGLRAVLLIPAPDQTFDRFRLVGSRLYQDYLINFEGHSAASGAVRITLTLHLS